MRKAMIQALALLLTLAFAQAAFADRSNRRQVRQNVRTHHGIKAGEINRGEARKLRQSRRAVRRVERRVKRDGEVGRVEQRVLNKMQNKRSRQIHRLKHNDVKQNRSSAK